MQQLWIDREELGGLGLLKKRKARSTAQRKLKFEPDIGEAR